MHAIIGFFYFIIDALFGLAILALIVSAVLSWLIAFDVINHRNRIVSQIERLFDAVTRPILAPFRRFVPLLGGVDISPIIAILVIGAARAFLLPGIFNPLMSSVFPS